MKICAKTVKARKLVRTTRNSLAHARTGAAAVEFALIAPLFLLLLAGIIEFGQAFSIEHTLSNASRRGARAAIFADATNNGVRQLVQEQVAKTLAVCKEDVIVDIVINGQVNADLSGAVLGDEIGVTVKVPFSKAGIGFYAKMFSNITLSATSILEHE